MAEMACPNCGHVVTLPERADLSASIAAGADADSATDAWLRRFPRNVGHFLRPFVRAQAHNMERGLTRRIEKRALTGRQRMERDSAELRRLLLERRIDLRHGRSVTWGRATDADLAEREGMYDEVITGGQAGKARVQSARALLARHGAACLDEIEGSERVVFADEFEPASADVVAPARLTARKPVTGRNTRGLPPGEGAGSTTGNAGRNRSR